VKVLFLNQPLIIKVIPRFYPALADTITLQLRNEQTDVVLSVPVTFTVDEFLNLTIITQPTDFKIQNKYEISVKNGANTIYKGKLIVLKVGTSVQNYEYKDQSNDYYTFK
jgi:hypothetical protein